MGRGGRVDIAIIGAGRLGRTLAAMWAARGHRVSVHGRGDQPPPSDVVLLAVPDRAIAEVAAAVAPGPVVLHASGATGLSALAPHARRGSLHPLMTFPGPGFPLPVTRGVAAAIAGDPESLAVARALALALDMVPFEVTGERSLYHAAAVIAGNYAATLLVEAARLLEAAGAPAGEGARMLLPLARASLDNVASRGPRAMTGPAVRGDRGVLDAHTRAIGGMDAELAELVVVLASRTARLHASAADSINSASGDPMAGAETPPEERTRR